jgi:hypothetical protein
MRYSSLARPRVHDRTTARRERSNVCATGSHLDFPLFLMYYFRHFSESEQLEARQRREYFARANMSGFGGAGGTGSVSSSSSSGASLHPLPLMVPTIVSGAVAGEPAPMPPPQIGRAMLRSLEILMPGTAFKAPYKETKTILQSDAPSLTPPEGMLEPSAYVLRRASQGTRYYELTRQVRETIFGAVHHAVEVIPSPGAVDGVFVRVQPIRQMAVKVYFRDRMRELVNKTRENPWLELAAGQFVSPHPHVMTLDDCCFDGENVYGIMEFWGGGEMYDVINSGTGPMTEAQARKFFRQIVSGLKQCHDLGISHRDMSLENIICKDGGEELCKIIDFGMCMRVPQDERGRFLRVQPQGIVGKKNYTAPEVIQNNQPFNPMYSDLWSIGVILFILLTAYPPMEAATSLDPRYVMICQGNVGALLANWGFGSLSPQVQHLLHNLLRPRPEDRLSLEQVLAHPWMSMG